MNQEGALQRKHRPSFNNITTPNIFGSYGNDSFEASETFPRQTSNATSNVLKRIFTKVSMIIHGIAYGIVVPDFIDFSIAVDYSPEYAM